MAPHLMPHDAHTMPATAANAIESRPPEQATSTSGASGAGGMVAVLGEARILPG